MEDVIFLLGLDPLSENPTGFSQEGRGTDAGPAGTRVPYATRLTTGTAYVTSMAPTGLTNGPGQHSRPLNGTEE